MTDDPIRDFNRHDAEDTAWLKSRPVCSCCGEPIQDGYWYHIKNNYYCDSYDCAQAAKEAVWDACWEDFLEVEGQYELVRN